MRILAVSDIHGDLGLVKKVEKMIDEENIDLVILAGDQTWFDQNTKYLVGPLTKKTALIIPSNHDSEETINNWVHIYPNLKSVHKTYFEKDNVGFFGSGTVDWERPEDSKIIFEELSNAHKKIKDLKKKIMVTHSPPKGDSLEVLGIQGSVGIKKAIKAFSPNFLICGHIHEAGGLTEKIYETKVMNVSRTPTIFEI